LDTFSIVFICTGNRFRSPLAEAFVGRLTRGLPVTTQSFGTLDLGDAPALPEAIEVARSCDIDLSGHRARYVSDADLAAMDLVLGFDEFHVRQAVVDAGAPREESFTIKQLARLLSAVTPAAGGDVVERARSAVQQADGLRLSEAPAGASDSMQDPLGAPSKVYRDTAVEIRELSLQLAEILFGVSDSSGLPPVPSSSRRRSRLHRVLRRG
jgi:protein-tyrosine phosphatase